MAMAGRLTKVLLASWLLVGWATAYNAERFGDLYEDATSGSEGAPGLVITTTSKANTTELTPEYFLDRGSKRAKLTYGPFPINPMSDGNGMNDYLQIGAQMPCEDCTITYLHAGLEYPDGSYANANTSLWLHHVVFIHAGVPDTVCGLAVYKGQRWFASGNERSVSDLSHEGKVPAGYYWPKHGINVFLLELMNQAMVPQEAVLSITYEWVPGNPKDFHQVTPVWLDVGGCFGTSDEPVKSDTSFEYDSPTYKAKFEGAILGMGGHLHDGGVYIDIVNNNETICQPHASYGESPGYWDQAGIPMTMNATSVDMQMSMGDMRMPHISSMGYCQAPAGYISLNDELGVNAFYNLTEYSPMLNADGSDADIMGISMIYAIQNMTVEELAAYVGPAQPNAYPDGPFVAQMTPWSPSAAMTCVPMRDSPGTLSAKTLDLTDSNTAMLYLMAVMDDACLQVWSNSYAMGFWYGIITVIVIATLLNRGPLLSRTLRIRNACSTSRNGQQSPSQVGGAVSRISGVFRAVSYPQVTPTRASLFAMFPSFGVMACILGYTAFICILSFVHTNTHDDQKHQSIGVRASWISMAQLPLIVVLATKRNFVGVITGVTYERLNILHRWTARGLLLTSTFHFGFQSYGWARLGLMKLEWSVDSCPPTGMAAYALVLWMNLSTLNCFRRLSYEFFVIQHILTFIGLIVAIMYHIPDTALSARNYVWAAIALYLASRFWQTAMVVFRNIRPSRASLTAVSRDVTKIVLPSKTLRSWTPGSHVLIRFPRLGFWQSHPVTIASTPTSHNGDLVFFMRSHTGLSKKLLLAAQQPTPTPYLTLIDGPYGGSQPDFAAYSSVVLIASSTGISFTLPILLDLADRASRHRLPLVKRLNFIWTSRDAAAKKWIPKELKNGLQTLRDEGVKADVSIYITDATQVLATEAPSTTEKLELSRSVSDSSSASEASGSISETSSPIEEKKQMSVSVRALKTDSRSRWSECIDSTHGRCDVAALLRREYAEDSGEMGVAVCGSLELSRDVRNTVARLQGGVTDVVLHVEAFGW